MERHNLFKDVLFFLYSKSKISGLAVDSWKCQKYAHNPSVISQYSCDSNIYPVHMTGMTIEMGVKSLNDLFDEGSPTSSELEGMAIDYSDEEDILPVTNHTHIPFAVKYREVKPVPQLSPSMAQPKDYIPDTYTECPIQHVTDKSEKLYDVIRIRDDIADKETLLQAINTSITQALSDIADDYDNYGVSAPYFTRFPRVGEISLPASGLPLMSGADINVSSYTHPSDADAYFMYKDLLATQLYIKGEEGLEEYQSPLHVTVIVNIPDEVLHDNCPDFLKHATIAFGFQIADWAKHTEWCLMGKQNNMIIDDMFVTMHISSSGTITASLDYLRHNHCL